MNIAIIGAIALVGSQLVSLAKSRGHEVIALDKQTGTDVTAPEGLEAVEEAEAMVDVTQSPSLSEGVATAFFSRAAENLGKAATEARVQRSVVLSIIGVDKIAAAESEPGTGFDGYYRAKFAQEQATLAFAPGPHVVRSSQFHDIGRQAIGWGRDGDRSNVRDLTIQPVAVSSMVEVLLAAATGVANAEVTEVAGPQREQLADLSARYAAHVGDSVSIVAAPVGDAVRHGILLPGSRARLVGPTFAEWLASVPVPRCVLRGLGMR
jgi:dTDP-4-dehydrorhamnose reductase